MQNLKPISNLIADTRLSYERINPAAVNALYPISKPIQILCNRDCKNCSEFYHPTYCFFESGSAPVTNFPL